METNGNKQKQMGTNGNKQKDDKKMEDRKVSIIVPVYRAEPYLKRCVDSLRNQIWNNIEIVLVDDGSPDQCPLMCDQYAGEDKRIRVIHKQNGGLVSAWQAGLEVSEADYICFVDSDDWVEPDMLSAMVPFLAGEDGEVVCCNFLIHRPDRETKHYHALSPGVYEGEKLEKEVKDMLLGRENRTISMSRCMKLIERSLLEKNRKYCSPAVTMGEDVNIMLPVLLDSRRVVIMEEALYYHYLYNDESMVHQYDAGMYEAIRTLIHAIFRIYEEKGRANGQMQAKKETVYLLLLALKNEIRGGQKGYIKRIKKICLEQENKQTAGSCPVEIRDGANRILYMILRHPGILPILAAKILFTVHAVCRSGKL